LTRRTAKTSALPPSDDLEPDATPLAVLEADTAATLDELRAEARQAAEEARAANTERAYADRLARFFDILPADRPRASAAIDFPTVERWVGTTLRPTRVRSVDLACVDVDEGAVDPARAIRCRHSRMSTPTPSRSPSSKPTRQINRQTVFVAGRRRGFFTPAGADRSKRRRW
jgi:hypothetical protein